jgi:hypothetical protein
MKILGISVIGVVIMALLFMSGLFNSSPVPLLAGFCGWTPMIFLLGWSVRSLLIGKRIMLVRNDEISQNISNNHRERVRNITKERNM